MPGPLTLPDLVAGFKKWVNLSYPGGINPFSLWRQVDAYLKTYAAIPIPGLDRLQITERIYAQVRADMARKGAQTRMKRKIAAERAKRREKEKARQPDLFPLKK